MNCGDEEYLQVILDPIKVCAHYRPKFGQGAKRQGLSLAEFQALYRNDPFYNWFGLDNPLMYAAHKAAGGMTSVYRQIGIGGEKLFRKILQDALELSPEDVAWSYQLPLASGKTRTLYLDGRIPAGKISDLTKRKRFQEWMRNQGKRLGVNSKVFQSLTGVVFEIRQGYKSKDSKRQNADIANAAAAYAKGYLPCAAILSTQIDNDILLRYRAEHWAVVTGTMGKSDPLTSTYDFLRDVIGYDLAGFFKRNSKTMKDEIDAVLHALLAPEAA